MAESDQMRTTLALTGTATMLCAAILAACTSQSPGNATSATTTAAPTSASDPSPTISDTASSLPAAGAPKVQGHLDTDKYRENPCLALTSSQSQELKVGASGNVESGSRGNGCTWSNSESGAQVNLQFEDQNSDGLTRVYRAHQAGLLAYFQEYPNIEGFPAVAADQVDSRATGNCILTVGVSDQLTFQVGTQQSRSKLNKVPACDVSVRVAKLMLETMKSGG